VVDAFDALANTRPYNTAPSADKALANIRANRAKWYDPEVVDAFIEMMDDQASALQETVPLPIPSPFPVQESL
jgi:response regulator RpfG family c-di-GMP phosphodiesterase